MISHVLSFFPGNNFEIRLPSNSLSLSFFFETLVFQCFFFFKSSHKLWTDFTNRPGKLPSRCFLKHIIPLEPGTLEGKASFSSRLKTRGTYDARVTEFQTPGRLSARTRLPPRFSRLSSFVSVLPSSSLRDNKVTSRVYGEIEVFPHSPPRYCRLQLFNRATSMILPPLRRVAKGQQ